MPRFFNDIGLPNEYFEMNGVAAITGHILSLEGTACVSVLLTRFPVCRCPSMLPDLVAVAQPEPRPPCPLHPTSFLHSCQHFGARVREPLQRRAAPGGRDQVTPSSPFPPKPFVAPCPQSCGSGNAAPALLPPCTPVLATDGTVKIARCLPRGCVTLSHVSLCACFNSVCCSAMFAGQSGVSTVRARVRARE